MTTKTDGQSINELLLGQFLKLGKVIPCGSLEVRKLASGAATFYWRVTINGKSAREVIGIYDPSASPKTLTKTAKGYSVIAAMRAAEALAAQHHSNLDKGGLAGVKAAEQEAKAQAIEAKVEAAQYTLQALLTDCGDCGDRQARQIRSAGR